MACGLAFDEAEPGMALDLRTFVGGRWRLDSIEQFGKALTRLEEVLERSIDDDIVLDALIHRYELSVDLCWKALKRKLSEEGIDATTPRAVLLQAYVAGWIHQEQVWLDMLRDRNLTSHTYREEQARLIYSRMPAYAKALREAYLFLEKGKPV